MGKWAQESRPGGPQKVIPEIKVDHTTFLYDSPSPYSLQ